MFEFLLLEGNTPFAIALGIVAFIAAIEIVGAFLGAGISSLVDGLLPDIDLDVDSGVGHAGVFSYILSWLCVGQVPFIVVCITFLSSFGLVGLFLQDVASTLIGAPLYTLLAIVVAFAISIPVNRIIVRIVRLILPRDETTAISRKTFIGRIATVTIGVARVGSPAEATFKDEHNQSHFVMVEPSEPGVEIPSGSQVLIIEEKGHIFMVTPYSEHF